MKHPPRSHAVIAALSALWALSALGACSGEALGPVPGAGMGRAPAGAPGVTPPGEMGGAAPPAAPGATCDPSRRSFAPARLWQLTDRQYVNVVRDVFGITLGEE